jgi:DNA-binding NarL/FixJ family response regulator
MITTIEELTTHVEQLETENQRLVDDVKKLESTISLLTLKLDQKNAVLQDISLKNLLPAGRQPGELSAALQSISKIIEREQEKEKLLDEAETLASEWQNEYFRNIKRQFPQLTFTDLKICTLLKKKLSTKEIARVINLTVRGVEASRYRIRKKLNVSSTTDLSEFLNAL